MSDINKKPKGKRKRSGTFNTQTTGRRKCSNETLALGECVLCNLLFKNLNERKNITLSRWEEIKQQAPKWAGLDRFGDLSTNIDWDNEELGRYMHKSCELDLFNERKLIQAENRNKKEKPEQKSENDPDEDDKDCSHSREPKRIRREGKIRTCVYGA